MSKLRIIELEQQLAKATANTSNTASVKAEMSYNDADKLMSIMFKRGHSFGAFSVSHDSHNRDLDTFIRSSMKSDYFPENIEQFFKWKSEEYAKSLGDKKCRS